MAFAAGGPGVALTTLGCAAIGLVWGWLGALRVGRYRPRLRLTSWLALALGVVLQGSVVAWLASPRAVIAFAVGLVVAGSAHLLWLGALARRWGRS